jgi:hypothetical protein
MQNYLLTVGVIEHTIYNKTKDSNRVMSSILLLFCFREFFLTIS